MTDDKRRFEKLHIRRDTILPPIKFLFHIIGKPYFPRGELVAATGKAKSPKTLFNAILMVCCFLDKVLQMQRLRLFKAAVQRFRPALLMPYGVLDAFSTAICMPGCSRCSVAVHGYGTTCSGRQGTWG